MKNGCNVRVLPRIHEAGVARTALCFNQRRLTLFLAKADDPVDTGPLFQLHTKLAGERSGCAIAEAHVEPARLQPHQPHEVANLRPHDGIAIFLAQVGNVLKRVDGNLRLRPFFGFGAATCISCGRLSGTARSMVEGCELAGLWAESSTGLPAATVCPEE